VRIGRFLGILACVGGTVLATGCGTEHVGSGGQPTGLAAAVSRTQEQTAKIALSIGYQLQGVSVSSTETGEYDFAHSRGTISMRSPYDMTEVFLPPMTYVKLPAALTGSEGAAGSLLPKGKTWIAMPDSEVSGSALLGAPEDGADPADLLAALTAVSSSEKKLGPSVIRGVPVTGYAVTIDSAKVGAVPGANRADVEGMLESFGDAAIPVDVWVDRKNLVRREQLTLTLPSGSGAMAGTNLTITTDFYDFGVPVRVAAPPAAEVTREPESFSAAGRVTPAVSASASASAGATATAYPPPAESGTLAPSQATAAEQAVAAFWAALGSDKIPAVGAAVVPAQRSCVEESLKNAGPTFKVSGLHITSAQPAGDAAATVWFTVKAEGDLQGTDFPMFPQSPTKAQWLAADEVGGKWYVNLAASTAIVFGGCG